MEKRKLLETWYKRVWLDEDLSAVDEMMTDSAPVHGLDTFPHVGAADFKVFVKAMLNLIKDTRISIDDYMEQGDRITVLMNVSAKCRKTSKPVQFFGLAMGTIVDDKITKAYNYVDFIGLFEQLGVLPQDAFQACLCGHQMRVSEN